MHTTNKRFTSRAAHLAAAIAIVAGVSLTSGSGIVSATTAEGSYHGNSSMEHMSPGHSQAATDLRVGMNNLLREHVTSSLHVTRMIAAGASESEIAAAKESQYLNSDDIAAAVGSIYGSEAQAQFSALFREHIVASNMYAEAVAANDEAAKQAAVTELQMYLEEVATFFSTAIPTLQKQDVYGLLNEHEELLNKSVAAYKAGDFVQSYQMEREALKQISRAADALSSGIIATQPSKF